RKRLESQHHLSHIVFYLPASDQGLVSLPPLIRRLPLPPTGQPLAVIPYREVLANTGRLAAEDICVRRVSSAAAGAEGKATGAALGDGVVDLAGVFPLGGGNVEAIFKVAEGHVAVHFLHLRLAKAYTIEHFRVQLAFDVLVAHIGAQGQHALKSENDG